MSHEKWGQKTACAVCLHSLRSPLRRTQWHFPPAVVAAARACAALLAAAICSAPALLFRAQSKHPLDTMAAIPVDLRVVLSLSAMGIPPETLSFKW